MTKIEHQHQREDQYQYQRETSRDRALMAEDAGFGRFSLLAVLAGTVCAFGVFGVVFALTAAVFDGLDIGTDLSSTDWRRLDRAGGLVAGGALGVAYLFGGYVAGRMARRAGVAHGAAVFVLGVAFAIGAAAAIDQGSDPRPVLDDLRQLGVPTSRGEWSELWTIAGVAAVLVVVVASVLGGLLGERWHGKLVARAMDPQIGPEADARRRSVDLWELAEQRREDARARGVRAAGSPLVIVPPIAADGGPVGRTIDDSIDLSTPDDVVDDSPNPWGATSDPHVEVSADRLGAGLVDDSRAELEARSEHDVRLP